MGAWQGLGPRSMAEALCSPPSRPPISLLGYATQKRHHTPHEGFIMKANSRKLVCVPDGFPLLYHREYLRTEKSICYDLCECVCARVSLFVRVRFSVRVRM